MTKKYWLMKSFSDGVNFYDKSVSTWRTPLQLRDAGKMPTAFSKAEAENMFRPDRDFRGVDPKEYCTVIREDKARKLFRETLIDNVMESIT